MEGWDKGNGEWTEVVEKDGDMLGERVSQQGKGWDKKDKEVMRTRKGLEDD